MTHRQKLHTLLSEYHPSNSEEVQFKKEILEFIEQYENCFERTLDVGHITASAWLLNKEGDKALLLHHAKLDRWFQLGGHCDGDPDVLQVSIKEAQEESGIENIEAVSPQIFDIDIHLIPANSRDKAHNHYDIRFLLQVTSDEQIIQNRESKSLRWIGLEAQDLPTDNPSVVRMHQKWLKLQK